MDHQLAAIAERLRTQDNRLTKEPMFCVQEKVRDWGYEPDYADGTKWFEQESGEYDEVEPETENAREVGYKDRWNTVMVAFTEDGCKEYLRLNGHNHKETRIYVESWNRCPQMIAIRHYLMAFSEFAETLGIVGNLSKDMRDGESPVAWIKRIIQERETANRMRDAGRQLLAYIDDDDISPEDSAKLLGEMKTIFCNP